MDEESDENTLNRSADYRYDPKRCIITTRSDDEDEEFYDCELDGNVRRDLFTRRKHSNSEEVLEETKQNLKLMCLAFLQYVERVKKFLVDPWRFDIRLFMLKNTMFMEQLLQDNKDLFYLNDFTIVDGFLCLSAQDEADAWEYSNSDKYKNFTANRNRANYLRSNTHEMRQYLIESATPEETEMLSSKTVQRPPEVKSPPKQYSFTSAAKRRRSPCEESWEVYQSRKRPCRTRVPPADSVGSPEKAASSRQSNSSQNISKNSRKSVEKNRTPTRLTPTAKPTPKRANKSNSSQNLSGSEKSFEGSRTQARKPTPKRGKKSDSSLNLSKTNSKKSFEGSITPTRSSREPGSSVNGKKAGSGKTCDANFSLRRSSRQKTPRKIKHPHVIIGVLNKKNSIIPKIISSNERNSFRNITISNFSPNRSNSPQKSRRSEPVVKTVVGNGRKSNVLPTKAARKSLPKKSTPIAEKIKKGQKSAKNAKINLRRSLPARVAHEDPSTSSLRENAARTYTPKPNTKRSLYNETKWLQKFASSSSNASL